MLLGHEKISFLHLPTPLVCDYFDLEALKAEAPEDAPDVTEEYERGAYNNPCREIREAMYYMAENGQK